MTTKRAFYCAICWQEFDDPRDHDAPSAYKGQRLNGHCEGDIRRSELTHVSKPKRLPSPEIPFTGEPLTFGAPK